MIANEIVGRKDFNALVKYAAKIGLIRITNDLDDVIQEVAMHILQYPPKKEYAPTTVILMACKWVQKEKAKIGLQKKFESQMKLCDFSWSGYKEDDYTSSLIDERDYFERIDTSDELDEVIEKSELTSHQLSVINAVRQGKSTKEIAEETKTTRQNVSLHQKNAITKMRETCTTR